LEESLQFRHLPTQLAIALDALAESAQLPPDRRSRPQSQHAGRITLRETCVSAEHSCCDRADRRSPAATRQVGYLNPECLGDLNQDFIG
jgi:hypothetical protein